MPESTVELRRHIEHDDSREWCPPLDRRTALRPFAMSTLAAVTGCGGSTAATPSSSATTSGTTTSTTTRSASKTTVEQGASLTLTASIAPTAATGAVTFHDGTTLLGTGTLASGTTTLSTSFSTIGTHSLTATHAGDTTYAASTSSAVTLTVSAASSCAETLEDEEGPYFVDDSASGYLRSNILSNLDGTSTQQGVPLT